MRRGSILEHATATEAWPAMGLLLARRAVAPLGEAIERQGRFVADASHELRTPLTLLHTRAQLVRRNLDAGDLGTMREEIAALERDAGRTGEVIEDLLLSAELGGGRAEHVKGGRGRWALPPVLQVSSGDGSGPHR
jgi:signal transduction histidine kinase